MASWVKTQLAVGPFHYTLHIGLDAATSALHHLGHSPEVEEARELFYYALATARSELSEGLERGDVAANHARQHPREYFVDVQTYLKQAGWGRPIKGDGVRGQVVWDWLSRWTPAEPRFTTWFGQPWRNVQGPQRKWFRRTVVATLIGLLAEEHQRFRFSTGDTNTLGVSAVTFSHRKLFQTAQVQASVASWRATRAQDDTTSTLSHVSPAHWAFHPCALQRLTLCLLSARLHEIKLKRPTKLARQDAQTWRDLWRQTLFHEASHAYSNTDDYYYYSNSVATGFRWFTDAACRSNVNAVCPNQPWLAQHHGAQFVINGVAPQNNPDGRVWPPGINRDLPLANADTVAAYLCGWRDPGVYPYG